MGKRGDGVIGTTVEENLDKTILDITVFWM